jgi:hypothetical protein
MIGIAFLVLEGKREGLAKASRQASPVAKKKNPRLLRVKGKYNALSK